MEKRNYELAQKIRQKIEELNNKSYSLVEAWNILKSGPDPKTYGYKAAFDRFVKLLLKSKEGISAIDDIICKIIEENDKKIEELENKFAEL